MYRTTWKIVTKALVLYTIYNIYYENDGMLIYGLNKLILIQNKQRKDF